MDATRALLPRRALGYCPSMASDRRAALAILLVPGSAGTLVALTATPPGMALAAAAPALCWTLVLVAAGRRRWGPALAMLLWGSGVAAPLSRVVNELLQAGGAHDLVAMVGAPVVEETLKATALVACIALLPEEVTDVRAGIVYGMLVGVGFAAVENGTYLSVAAIAGGSEGLLAGLYLRGFVEGLNHALFTGALGAGLGWARGAGRGRARVAAPLVGFGAAVGQHGVWNAFTSRAITAALCGAEVAGGPCVDSPGPHALLVTAPLIVAVSLGPGALALLAVVRAAAARGTAVPRGTPAKQPPP